MKKENSPQLLEILLCWRKNEIKILRRRRRRRLVKVTVARKYCAAGGIDLQMRTEEGRAKNYAANELFIIFDLKLRSRNFLPSTFLNVHRQKNNKLF